MALKYSDTVKNAKLDALETAIGVSPILRLYTGAPPATVGAAATGTLLAEMTLPSDWMAAASGGIKVKAGTWQDAAANATGLSGYFRILTGPAGTVTHMQGTMSGTTAPTGDMIIDEATGSITILQSVTIATFTLTSGN